MPEDLKPCPFCGGNDLRHTPGTRRGAGYVLCEDCGGDTGEHTWNTRVPPPEAEALARAVEFDMAKVTDHAGYLALWKAVKDYRAKFPTQDN